MKAHQLDLVSLIAGSVFVFLGMAQLMGVNVVTGWGTLLRAWPLLLVGAGVVVLVSIVRSARDA